MYFLHSTFYTTGISFNLYFCRQVSHLESSTASMCDDLLNKTSIIERYVANSNKGAWRHNCLELEKCDQLFNRVYLDILCFPVLKVLHGAQLHCLQLPTSLDWSEWWTLWGVWEQATMTSNTWTGGYKRCLKKHSPKTCIYNRYAGFRIVFYRLFSHVLPPPSLLYFTQIFALIS